MAMRRQRIAIFGGSFNPPHLGHILCATYAHARAHLDAVWVFPVAEHPYAKDLAPWDLRWDMCERAFGSLGFCHIRDDERHNPGGRTYNLLTHLMSEYPNTDWHLIGGTDTHKDLPNWYNGKELQQQLTIIAIPRAGYDNDPLALPNISSSLIRERLQAGSDVTPYVPQSILDQLNYYGKKPC